MDNLTKLQVFSIGNNNIPTLESVSLFFYFILVECTCIHADKDDKLSIQILQLAYLMKFENLRVLHASGNPVFKLFNYKNYCLAHLRNLKYLDYRLVDPESVRRISEIYLGLMCM